MIVLCPDIRRPSATTRTAVTAYSQQWQAAELAMNVARRGVDGWLQANQEETPSTASRYAYHTTIHEASPCLSPLGTVTGAGPRWGRH